MAFCVPYNKNFKYNDEVNEITITYNAKDLSLPAFLEKHSTQTINIKICSYHTELDVERIRLLFEKYRNIKAVIDIKDKALHEMVSDAGIPYFFSNFPRDWDMLIGMLNEFPTDIYVTNELCFALDKIKKICEDMNIRIRVIPHIAQSSWEDTVGYYKFFIRPDDLDIYDKYVDVYDFFLDKNLNVLYKVYAYDKTWFGNLREIIGSLHIDIENRDIGPSYAVVRSRCDKKCIKGKSCSICRNYAEISKKLFDKGYIFKKK